MIEKILVANRGEIAVRIIRTCQEMGIKTATIYSDVDANSLHVQMADEAASCPSVRSYLDMDCILETAQKVGAQAIHPGYGFLSENHFFAAKCQEAGLIFIGPDARAIELMGDKARARETMMAAGVPVTPGSNGIVNSIEEALEIAGKIGYPVLVKAVAGGGGRGMRLARTPEELTGALEAAKSEANTFFSNADVYLEKFLEYCRHVEIQILADHYGQVVYLGERDCSIQRRNQKLIEEAPSPAVSPELRERMGKVAVAAARAVGYSGAGTLEFLLDKYGNFYFMEMNTRIQVEHPVTEFVCGMDLVKKQIQVASGEPLGYTQSMIKMNGWAIECRINAENPETFMPSPGEIKFFRPPGGYGIRLDTAIFNGSVVSPYYDSMVAKLIVYGQSRMEVIKRMLRALAEFEIEGVDTTLSLHQKILADPDFQRGKFTTHYIQEKMEQFKNQKITKNIAVDEEDNVRDSISPGDLTDSGQIDPEIIAVIAAAVTTYGEAGNSNYRITGINPVGKACLPWRLAGLYDLMGRL
ncbi:MAG: acetyl-CoA carboxylase biotin carboxylase subunit [Desulfitobacteriaceae bacterium]